MGATHFTGPVYSTNGFVGPQTVSTLAVSGAASFAGPITLADAVNIAVNATTGSKIGTLATQKLGFFGAAPLVQPAATGVIAGFAAATGTPVLVGSTFTGNIGTKAYTISDIVAALKGLGLMAPS